MEFVEGRPITEHCEAEGLGLPARLALMQVVADAVAHAHRHLVIHRDLKPGNVLVTAGGAVKLLDFGIARILAEPGDMVLTEAILTPSYAAPEQFEGRNITTATDVYALGAVLFELLTGRPPWDAAAFSAARFLQEEPPRASRTAVGEAARTIRRADLEGDLDAIVAKAMRARPEDRYESAAAFGADLGRHLALRPVEARAGDSIYQVRRFLRRNRGRVAAGLVTGAAIAAGVVASGIQRRRAVAERAVAREESARAHAVRDYLMLMLRTASREGGPSFRTAKQILDGTAAEAAAEIEGAPGAAGLALLRVLGELYIEMDDFEAAAPLIAQEAALARRLGDRVALARARQNRAVVSLRRGRLEEARQDLAAAEQAWAADPLRFARESAEAAGIRAALLRETGRREEGLTVLKRTLERLEALLGPGIHEAPVLTHNIGVHLFEMGRLKEAEAAFAESFRLLEAQGRLRSTIGIAVTIHRAGIAFRTGRAEEAERMWREAIAARRELYGPSTALAFTQMNLGRMLLVQGRHEEALPLLEEGAEIALAFAGPASPVTIMLRQSRAMALGLSGRLDEAGEEIELALATGEAAFGSDHLYQALGHATRAQLRLFGGDPAFGKLDLAAARAIAAAAGPAGEAHRAELDQLEAILDQAAADQGSAPVISR
jgi:non-specific serine/threonine protein kinase/serine/threonine-protein kinase